MSKKKTTEEFIEEVKKISPEYDYSLVDYVNSDTKVKVICPEHGVFEQFPTKLLVGTKCRKCAYKNRKSNRLTTKEFIERARKIHGDKYDYSLVDYKNGGEKVKIICPKHGIFEQIAGNHLNGCNCPKCIVVKKHGKVRVRDTESFIKESKKIHGDKYDYSLVEYINAKTKVKIICPIHGTFEQSPRHHLEGSGCKECSKGAKKQQSFIEESKLIHGDKYDYSLVNYVNNRTKVKIICRKCKKIFEQSPDNHLKGKGCPNCKNSRPLSLTQEEFIEKSNLIHDNKYDYSLVEYKGIEKKIKIICPKHGVFEQLAASHMKGHGCQKCAIEAGKLTQEEFIERSKKVHGNKYDYSLVKYVDSKTEVKIICKKCGKIFEQKPENHYNGANCPCSQSFKGEQRIANYLIDKNIKYIPQKNYDDLINPKTGKKLRYDFYIEERNLLIEFNGIQHYEPVEHFGGKETFEQSQYRDKLKIDYAQKNNIKLLTIPYWDYDRIEEILGEAIDY